MVESLARVTRTERKEWAREVFRGGENTLLPSLTPDLVSLDEEGIRHDVRTAIEHGFFSMFCPAVGLNPEERTRFLEIAVDEAQGKINVSTGVGGGSVDAVVEALHKAEALGCSHVMLSLPASLKTADELLDFANQAVESTDLGIVLYATSGKQFRHLHPSNVVFDVFEPLSDQPNVVAMKLTQTMDPVTAFECCERLGDKLLLGPVNLELAPFMAKRCQIQYTGMWQVDSHQSIKQPYVIEYMKLLSEGRIDEVVGLYYRFQPLVKLFWDIQAPLLKDGGHPWGHLKYYQWATGGNGGLLRPGKDEHSAYPPVTAADREWIRSTYKECGITIPDNDDEFFVGKVNSEKGLRLKDIEVPGYYAG